MGSESRWLRVTVVRLTGTLPRPPKSVSCAANEIRALPSKFREVPSSRPAQSWWTRVERRRIGPRRPESNDWAQVQPLPHATVTRNQRDSLPITSPPAIPRGGSGSLNRIPASLSGTPTGVRGSEA